MIKLYTGTPGSGKSLHLARRIMRYLNCRKNRLVICNFEINLDLVKHPERFIYVNNNDLSPEIIVALARTFFEGRDVEEDTIILIIDECQLLFNTRDWGDKSRRPWLDFFSQHRKYGVLCYLVAQYDQMIDKQIRALIEYETIHRKVSRIGWYGMVLKIFTFGDWYICIDVFYSMNLKVNCEWFRSHKKLFRLYNTFNTFDRNDSGDSVLALQEGYRQNQNVQKVELLQS